jgi:hypothetical protein
MVTQPFSNGIHQNNNPVTGGVLSIISGSITLLMVIFYWSFLRGPIFAYGGMMVTSFFFSILAIFGGVLASKRKEWTLSLAGAVASMFSFVGLLGIVATILIATSKKEFNKPSTA